MKRGLVQIPVVVAVLIAAYPFTQMSYAFVCDNDEQVCPVPTDQQQHHDAPGETPRFYVYQDVFPQLETIKVNYDIIQEELDAILAGPTWPSWPEQLYEQGTNEWRVFPFCYTFPGHDVSKTAWVEDTSALCPRTTEILRSIPGIRTALFSKLGPKTTLTMHQGYADLANFVLRTQTGFAVPKLANGEPCCAVVVEDESQFQEEREIIVFDDSKDHYAYNNHPEKTRIVLIVDVYRPDYLPRGQAQDGQSDELAEFIENFGQYAFSRGQVPMAGSDEEPDVM